MNLERTVLNYMLAIYLAILHYATRVRQDWPAIKRSSLIVSDRNSGVNCIHVCYLRYVASLHMLTYFFDSPFFDIPCHSSSGYSVFSYDARITCGCPVFSYDAHIACGCESIRLCFGYRWMRRRTPSLWESQLTSCLGRSLPAGPGSASRFRPNLLSHTRLHALHSALPSYLEPV